MKKYLLATFVIGLLILDWLALDDITTGSEPNYDGEWAILIVSAAIFGFLIFKKLLRRPAKK
ncbi:hypothetical protein A2376_03300 [Candidatus Woesebacteria bacterium RIFOXYB1_FULL_47_31]|uniref:Uncharacterized protein n=2 Tax=Candidatus Woeseibacteriota TaxID=1752722 RepID=A0A1F8D7F1_9BACT|nr:MAG: hypothetical protein A2376_03300 [Candidatus Woesebacteria bacterium RIFOXYB1_FULL_47_31]OGM85076.1 MAG: hypothetical protein A2435_02095 [Candidatus Woesebacteria bacterium RIFOXYC1_FULL_46_16]